MLRVPTLSMLDRLMRNPNDELPTLVDIVWRDVQKAYNIHKPVLSLDCTQRNLGGPFNANCIAVERYHNEGILECLMSRRFKPLTNPTHSSTQSKEGQGLTQSKARELSDQYQSLKEQELWREQKRLRIANNRSKRKAQRSYAHPRSRLQLQRERTKAAEGSADDRGF